MISTALTRARRSQAALALDPIPASKVQSVPLEFAELDKHNYFARNAAPSACPPERRAVAAQQIISSTAMPSLKTFLLSPVCILNFANGFCDQLRRVSTTTSLLTSQSRLV